jgi:uncharacterized protein (TIGR02453 family)
MAGTAYFTAELFGFLDDLRRHNDRAWFQENKQRYDSAVRDPCLDFVAALAPRLGRVSAHFLADPSPVGGSMMRIYRDLRFAKDKTPYKTELGFHFRHAAGRQGAPAFYLHIAPENCFAAGGAWQPPPEVLSLIRGAIAAEPRKWARVKAAERSAGWVMAGGGLKRAPPGYDAEHRFIDDIKRKDFAASLALSVREITGRAAIDAVLGKFEAIAPLMRFLTEAVGLPY